MTGSTTAIRVVSGEAIILFIVTHPTCVSLAAGGQFKESKPQIGSPATQNDKRCTVQLALQYNGGT